MFEKSIFSVVATPASSITAFVEVTRTFITSRMSSNFSQIRSMTAELAALECLKNQYLVLWAL